MTLGWTSSEPSKEEVPQQKLEQALQQISRLQGAEGHFAATADAPAAEANTGSPVLDEEEAERRDREEINARLRQQADAASQAVEVRS